MNETEDILKNAGEKIADGEQFYDKKDKKIPWKHGGYKAWYNCCNFFRNPYKKPQKDLNLLEQVEILLTSEGKIDEELLKRCEHLIRLQRITENTNARKRLEKWTKRLIVWYFTIIALIVIAAAFKFRFYACGHMHIFYLSDNVLITLLSTTTINIIGVVIILMRGHFPHKDDGKKSEETINNEI